MLHRSGGFTKMPFTQSGVWYCEVNIVISPVKGVVGTSRVPRPSFCVGVQTGAVSQVHSVVWRIRPILESASGCRGLPAFYNPSPLRVYAALFDWFARGAYVVPVPDLSELVGNARYLRNDTCMLISSSPLVLSFVCCLVCSLLNRHLAATIFTLRWWL